MFVKLNVGGVVFTTTKQTLTRHDSYFSGLVEQSIDPLPELFVDRDSTHFRHILNYMRGSSALPSDYDTLRQIYVEAEFYSLPVLCEHVRQQLAKAHGRDLAMLLQRIADRL